VVELRRKTTFYLQLSMFESMGRSRYEKANKNQSLEGGAEEKKH